MLPKGHECLKNQYWEYDIVLTHHRRSQMPVVIFMCHVFVTV